MAVGEHDGGHRLVAQVLAGKGQRRGRAFAGGERVHHDPAGLAIDERDVPDVEAAQLVHAIRHLEQAELGIQHRVAPQAWVDGGRRLALDELVGVEVDQHGGAVGGQDLAFGPRDEAAPGVLEVLRIVELDLLGECFVGFLRGHFGVAGRATDAGGLAATGKGQEIQWAFAEYG
ncbi:hypothetical protein [Candidatus Skiveiella danica]|uniref:hypothetical protein n=1 Tax=Candidatus Skiveiella danica TaxID=3386177 RepID=UPI0039B91009